ncbi:filament integrity protein FraC [Prochlorothrix hollandica]|uniref:filament integrity protein FraC n=1 Tax=Prochlorothrix hollandica TaxID=1223 RepID=UPI003341594A
MRVLVFQILLLLVVIALEAMVLQQKLGISERGSVQFSTVLNLFSTIVGWLVFLVVELVVPERWRLEIIDYVLFNGVFQLDPQTISTVAVVCMLLICITTFFMETQALNLLLLVLRTQPQVRKDTNQVQINRMSRYQASWTDQYRMNTLLIANACSYGAVLVILFLRQVFMT